MLNLNIPSISSKPINCETAIFQIRSKPAFVFLQLNLVFFFYCSSTSSLGHHS